MLWYYIPFMNGYDHEIKLEELFRKNVVSDDVFKIDLAEISRKSDGNVHFTLPGGYTLKNTKEGVDIGGFVFDDKFTDFRPLWDSDVIACRDYNYRLVYRYKEKV